MEFVSDRLIFREFREEDFERFYSVFSDEQVMKYAMMDRVASKEDVQPFFNRVLDHNRTTDGRKNYEFGLFLQASGQFVGFADMEVYRLHSSGGTGEIGYFLLPGHWGQGYASEIGTRLLEFGFDHVKLHRISASCNANNSGSEKVMRKIGMSKEGEIRKTRYKDGRWDNELKYGILLEEWNSNR